MSPTLIMAFCILGCDFPLYAPFQWTFAERRAKLSRPRQPSNRAIDGYAMRSVPKFR